MKLVRELPGQEVAAWISAAQESPLLGWNALQGGEEGAVYQVNLQSTLLVVRVAPSWESRSRLEWASRVSLKAMTNNPCVVAPCAVSGNLVNNVDGRLVVVFPFVAGTHLNRDREPQRVDAAKKLAGIHQSLLAYTDPEVSCRQPPRIPPALADDSLDSWVAHSGSLLQGVAHGDYYRRNLICRGDEIVGIVDWTDAWIGPLVLEVAGATFELCKNDRHELLLDRADQFIEQYSASGGPVPKTELDEILPAIREWIRRDIAAGVETGAIDDYVRLQMNALEKLRSLRWRVG